MKLKATFIVILFIICAFATEPNNDSSQSIIQSNFHEIGGFVGFTSGNGLSYRMWHDFFAVEFVFFPWYYKNGEEYYEHVLVGVGYLQSFKEYAKINVVGHITLAYRILDGNDQRRDTHIMAGAGPGIVYRMQNDSRVYYTLLSGISYYGYNESSLVAPTIDFGIHFRL